MDEEAVKWSAERIGQELNFIQGKLIGLRETLDGITEALILSAYVQAATSNRPIDDRVREYLRKRVESITA